MSSSDLLRLLPVTSFPPFIFPSITVYRRQFLRSTWPIQLAFSLLISCRIFLCSLTLSNTYSFLTCSVQLIFSILLQHHISKLPAVSDLLPEASKFRRHIKLYSKCNILLVYSSVLHHLTVITKWSVSTSHKTDQLPVSKLWPHSQNPQK
jgi:hypothetical protein